MKTIEHKISTYLVNERSMYVGEERSMYIGKDRSVQMKRGDSPRRKGRRVPLTERSRKAIEKVRWEMKRMERKVDIVLQYDNFNVAFFLSTSDSLHGHLSPLSVSSSLCHNLQVNDPLCSYFLSDSAYFSLFTSLSLPLFSLSIPLFLSPFLSLSFSLSLFL